MTERNDGGSFRARYERVRPWAQLDAARASAIVRAARPHAAALLSPPATPESLDVAAVPVQPADARGGSLIPAWPFLHADGRVTIEFVEDWGALLAGWWTALGEEGASLDVEELIASGERPWVGIANDVLQQFVPDPPAGTYSMVRHHALMLAAATTWLGEGRARRWQAANAVPARAFVGRLDGRPLWDAIESAERGLASLLADPRAREPAHRAVEWLDDDPVAASAYVGFLGAASLGIAALLATAPAGADRSAWLRTLIHEEHPDPDFNRDRIEAFARQAGSSRPA